MTITKLVLLQEEVSKVQSGMSLDINLERSRVKEEVSWGAWLTTPLKGVADLHHTL